MERKKDSSRPLDYIREDRPITVKCMAFDF